MMTDNKSLFFEKCYVDEASKDTYLYRQWWYCSKGVFGAVFLLMGNIDMVIECTYIFQYRKKYLQHVVDW